MVQETKLKPNETISCASINDFQVYYKNRQESQGGGIALGVSKEFESTLIKEGEGEVEALSVKVFLKEIQVRAVTAYGPQENETVQLKNKFWAHLDLEVAAAENYETGVIIQMDGNLWAGGKLIPGDPNEQNNNGKLFELFLSRNPHLTCVNALQLCEGLITRIRKTKNGCEKSVLDIFIVYLIVLIPKGMYFEVKLIF